MTIVVIDFFEVIYVHHQDGHLPTASNRSIHFLIADVQPGTTPQATSERIMARQMLQLIMQAIRGHQHHADALQKVAGDKRHYVQILNLLSFDRRLV